MKTQDTKPQGSKGSAGIKFLVSAFSLAGILTFWNMFANKNFSDSINSFMQLLSAGGQPPVALVLDMPPIPPLDPLPTVMAYVQINLQEISVDQSVAETSSQKPQQPVTGAEQPLPVLRVVGAPTPAPVVQMVKPKIEQVESPSVAASGGGGGGGSKKSGGSSGGGSSKSSK